MADNCKKYLFVVLIILLLAATLTSCEHSDAGIVSERDYSYGIITSADYVYLAQSIELPDDLGIVGELAHFESKIFFTCIDNNSITRLYAINADGTDLKLLDSYTPSAEKPDDAGGLHSIPKMTTDNNGNIWIIEFWEFYIFDLPDSFSPDSEDIFRYKSVADSGVIVRKLDVMGAELLCVDVTDLLSQINQQNIRAFAVDSSENIYIGYAAPSTGSTVITVVDTDGHLLLNLDTNSDFQRFVYISDESIAFPMIPFEKQASIAQSLQVVDISNRMLGNQVSIADIGHHIFNGGGLFDVLISDNSNLYGYVFGEDYVTRLIDLNESNITGGMIRDFSIISDEQILCAIYRMSNTYGSLNTEMFVLTRTPRSEIPDKTVLTIAAMGISPSLSTAIAAFNQASELYRIDIIDYLIHAVGGDYTAAHTRFLSEINAGKIPDMIDVTGFPYAELASRGVLADLYQFLDSDPKYGRDDFVEAIFRATEIDGSLYQISPAFSISTIIGHPYVLGSDTGWNMEEFISIIESHPEADIQAGIWLDKVSLLNLAIGFSIDNYINFDIVSVNFNTDDFIMLLEYCARYPGAINFRDGLTDADMIVPPEIAIPSGRQIMLYIYATNFESIRYYRELFGSDIVFKGFPTASKNGNAIYTDGGIAISQNSQNKEAAWEFVRTILDKDGQLSNAMIGFPTNKAAFNHIADRELDLLYRHHNPNPEYDADFNIIRSPEFEELALRDLNAILDVIESVSGMANQVDNRIYDIINESAEDYFKGILSAQEAARIIQNKLEIYISERS